MRGNLASSELCPSRLLGGDVAVAIGVLVGRVNAEAGGARLEIALYPVLGTLLPRESRGASPTVDWVLSLRYAFLYSRLGERGGVPGAEVGVEDGARHCRRAKGG